MREVAIFTGLMLSWSAACPAVAAGFVSLAQVTDERITEASGIVASRRNPGCYYIHNDSGDSAHVFLIDRTGRVRLEIRLADASEVDYEDIALAPGNQPGTFDVCVADIGDNNARRKDVRILRFPEPPLPESAPVADQGTRGSAVLEVHPTVYTLKYGNGPANAEAFCVHPRTGDGYILTKRWDGSTVVYKLSAPWPTDEKTVLRQLCTVELPAAPVGLARIVTAADIAPDGRRLAVRCYVNGWEWRLPAGAEDADFDRIFSTTPTELDLPGEPQGEALCYSPDGTKILTISEGREPTLYEIPAPAP